MKNIVNRIIVDIALVVACLPLTIVLMAIFTFLDLACTKGPMMPLWVYLLELDALAIGYSCAVLVINEKQIERWRFSDWKIENKRLINVKWRNPSGSRECDKNDPEEVIILRKGNS